MHRAEAILILCMAAWLAPAAPGPQFDGKSAFEFTRRVVALGPRPVGSEAHKAAQAIIRQHLRGLGFEVIEDVFTARTPDGPKTMRNIIGRLPASSLSSPSPALVFSGHYDTKVFPDVRFVGANDGGSSTGFLMELARVVSLARPRRHDVYLVWLDGEEAFREWTAADSLYGSRHLADRWAADGTARRIRALINVDMIGDRELELVAEATGTAWLRKLVWETAARLGYGAHFSRTEGWIGDDHVPFLEKGIPAINLIDFHYGPGHEYWHTAEDTMDKLSPRSFQVVGDVILAVIHRFEQEKNK